MILMHAQKLFLPDACEIRLECSEYLSQKLGVPLSQWI
jgi:hypothetical protein